MTRAVHVALTSIFSFFYFCCVSLSPQISYFCSLSVNLYQNLSADKETLFVIRFDLNIYFVL